MPRFDGVKAGLSAVLLHKISVHFGSDDKLLEPRVEKFVVVLALQMLLGVVERRLQGVQPSLKIALSSANDEIQQGAAVGSAGIKAILEAFVCVRMENVLPPLPIFLEQCSSVHCGFFEKPDKCEKA